MNRALLLLLVVATAACGGAEVTAPENPVRAGLEQSIATLDPQTPLALRYNPAACACPPAEIRLGGQWLRAELAGDVTVRSWLAALARTPPDNLPVPLEVVGRVDRDVLRTAQGSYAAHVDVVRILAPLPPTAAKPAP